MVAGRGEDLNFSQSHYGRGITQPDFIQTFANRRLDGELLSTKKLSAAPELIQSSYTYMVELIS